MRANEAYLQEKLRDDEKVRISLPYNSTTFSS